MRHTFMTYFQNAEEVRKSGWCLDSEQQQTDFVKEYQQLQDWFIEASTISSFAPLKIHHGELSMRLVGLVDKINNKNRYVLLCSNPLVMDYRETVYWDFDTTTKFEMDTELLRCKMMILRDILESLKVREEVVKFLEVCPKGFCSTESIELVYRKAECDFWNHLLSDDEDEYLPF